jgi:methionyl-tRNA formyltransferase
MSGSGLRIVLVGEESAAVHALRSVLAPRTADSVVAVMTAGVGPTSLASVAASLGIPVWPAELVKDPRLAGRIRDERIDLVLNVHSLFLVNEQVAEAARVGAFNLHPGPLPEYAGLNCVSWAIYHGEERYGVTVHRMARGVDTGDIAYRADFPIGPEETPLSLTHKCVRHGAPLLARLLDDAAAGAIPRIRQDLSRRRRFGKQAPDGGRLRWSRPAAEVVNFVRACDYAPFVSPWGLPRARWGDRTVSILKAARTHLRCEERPGVVARRGGRGALVACADEWVEVRRMQIDGAHVAPEEILKPGDALRDGV